MMKSSSGRNGCRRGALSQGLGGLLVSLLVLGVALRAGAQQNPPGCSGTGFQPNIFEEKADGSALIAGSAVSPCETIQYFAQVGPGGGNACCFMGGPIKITTPRTCATNADCTDNPNGTCGTVLTGRCTYDVT